MIKQNKAFSPSLNFKVASKSVKTAKLFYLKNSYYNNIIMQIICDRLCENLPCSRVNFDLFLQFQNAITFT